MIVKLLNVQRVGGIWFLPCGSLKPATIAMIFSHPSKFHYIPSYRNVYVCAYAHITHVRHHKSRTKRSICWCVCVQLWQHLYRAISVQDWSIHGLEFSWNSNRIIIKLMWPWITFIWAHFIFSLFLNTFALVFCFYGHQNVVL